MQESIASKTEKKWYILQSYSGMEKKAKSFLEERISGSDFKSDFGEIIFPVEEVIDVKDGKRRKVERKLFPGYILINMNLNDDSWALVKKTPNILGFVGGVSQKPHPLSDEEVSAILNKVEVSHDKPVPKTLYNVGESVRIIEGPFADFDGIIEEVNYEKGSVIVGVTIFGRKTPLEVSFMNVKKIV